MGVTVLILISRETFTTVDMSQSVTTCSDVGHYTYCTLAPSDKVAPSQLPTIYHTFKHLSGTHFVVRAILRVIHYHKLGCSMLRAELVFTDG